MSMFSRHVLSSCHGLEQEPDPHQAAPSRQGLVEQDKVTVEPPPG